MKNNLRRIFTIPNIAVIFSALYICFQVYELPAKVKNLQERVYTIEKENIILKAKLDLCLSTMTEVKADVKQILKDVK